MSALDNIKVAKDKPFSIDDIQVAKDKPFSIDNIKVTKDKPFSIDNIKVATDEDMGQIIDNKLDNTPSTSLPLQSELSLPEQIYQQHLKGQGYPDPKAKGILQLTREMFQWWGKKEWERGRTLPLLIANLNPTLGGVPLAQVGDKIINYGNMVQRIPATVLMLAKNKHEGKPNINNVSTKEALINAVKGDPTKPYGNVSLFVAIPRVIYPEKDWDIEQEVYKNASLVTKTFMDAPAFLGDISLTFITAGRIFLPAMKFISPSGKMSRIASKSVENAKQMILEHEELAKIKLDEIAKVDGYNVKLNQIQQDKINIDTLSGVADAIKLKKKELANAINTNAPNIDSLKLELSDLNSTQRGINKVIVGAKPELFDKINQLPKDINALQSEVLADHTLIKNTLGDIIKSGVKSTGAEQEGIDQINKAYKILSEDIAKQSKDITSMQSAQSRIDNIKRMLVLSDNMKGKIGNQVKRQLYSRGVQGMIKTSSIDEYTGQRVFKGILNETKLNNVAKTMTHGRITKWRELDGTDIESLYDMFKGVQQIDKKIGTVREVQSWVSPEFESFQKLGALWLHKDIEDGVFAFTNLERTVDRTLGDFLDKFKSVIGKKWGSVEDDMLSHILDNPNQIPEIYKQPEVAGLLNQTQKDMVKEGAVEWRKLTDYTKDMLLKEGYLSEDVAGFNALKDRKKILDDSLSVMRVGRGKLKPKTADYRLATIKINEVRAELYKVNHAINIHPPLVVENYYSHKSMLAKNILDDMEQMKYAKDTGWSFDSLPPYAKNSFAGIAVNINSPEVMKRLKDGTIFRRDAMPVMREALLSEGRKGILQPIFEKGKAYIDALPDGDRKLKLHEMYDALVRVTRNMEHPMDKIGNVAFSKASKGIEKTVQSVTHGRLHYVAQTRAFDHFVSSIRQLAFMKTLWGNTLVVTKNTFQITQSIATIGARATLAGVEGAMVRDGMWTLEQLSTFLGSLHPIENFVDPKGMMGWANDVGMIGQTLTERNWNRAGAGLGAIYHAVTKSQKNMDDLMKFALTHNIDPKSVKGNNFWSVWRQYVEAGNGKEIMDGANRNIRTTQYDYARYSTMPLLHSSLGKILLMFSNWPSHYFMSFLPQIWRQLIRGTSTLEVAGVHYKWTDPDRYGIFKYILATAGTYAIGKSLGFDMGWQSPTQQLPTGNLAGTPVPVTISPPIGLLMDIGTCVIDSMQGKTQGAESAWARVINDVCPNAVKHVVDIITEKQPPQSIIMKTDQNKEIGNRGVRTHPSRSSRPTRISR